MNDSEIIKALTTSSDPNNLNCQPTTKLCKEALELIIHQQAEIDRLNIEINIETVKSEAVRKFAEKLAIKLAANYSDKYCHWIDDTIYELVEEMGCNDG